MAFDPIKTIKNWFTTEKKDSVDLGTINSEAFRSFIVGINPVIEPENLTFPEVAHQAFERNVITYKCVMMRADAVGDLKINLFNKKTNKQVLAHPLLDLISRPNPMQGKNSFLQHAVADYLLDGNMFIEKVRPSPNSSPARLWPLQPNYVQVIVGTARIPISYVYIPGGVEAGSSKTFPVDPTNGNSDVLHLKSYAPLRESMIGRGLSPVRSAWMSVLSHNEAVRWNFALLKNSGRPSGALQTDNDLTEEQIAELRQQIESNRAGSSNAGKPLLLAGGLKWQEMSLSPTDMAWLEGKDGAARDIALALKVPPILLHIPGDSTYNNVQEANLAFYEGTVLPQAHHIIDELNRWLVPDFDPNLEFRIDYDCISALAPRRQDKWNSIGNASFLTINEKRTALGYEPITNGDDILVPSTMLPLAESIDATEQVPPPDPEAAPPTDDEDEDDDPTPLTE